MAETWHFTVTFTTGWDLLSFLFLAVPVALWKHCRAHMQLSIAQLVVLLIRWKPTTRSNPDWFHHSTGEIPCEYVKGTLVSQSDA